MANGYMNIIKFDEDLKNAFKFNNVKIAYEIIQSIDILGGGMPPNTYI